MKPIYQEDKEQKIQEFGNFLEQHMNVHGLTETPVWQMLDKFELRKDKLTGKFSAFVVVKSCHKI